MHTQSPEPNVTAAAPASRHFRLRWRPLGDNVRVGVYGAPDRFVTHVNLGWLTFSGDEWAAFRAIVGDQVEIMHWDEPLPAPPA